ncbi:MAG TPA: 16S rRNA (uracil(1498)-N(3))-methyltransferase [Leeuwenhoekiella sp.]|nr:16S rRNA (uracil(1498)-N(3))-methyltransferase [Leeuwenhoekiella sp.]
MQLFYNADLNPQTTTATFPKEESKHIVKVLRKKEGEILDFTDGNGNFYKAEIIQPSASKCQVKILEVTAQQGLPYRLHLAVAPTKLNDRYETFLEKATEIGITEITPIICDHSERKVIKPERYARILQSAMKQSLKAYLPELNAAITFKEFIIQQATNKDQRFIAHCEEGEQRFSLKQKLKPGADILLLIGPEGDFSPEEIDFARSNGFQPVTLGESRLRTETAAIVAAHSVAFLNEA